LTHFYSEDHISSVQNDSKDRIKLIKKSHRAKNMTTDLQKNVWNLPHSSADKHVAGKLSLCLSMPVIIKNNIATELGITNGQEGTIAGWQSCLGARDQLMMETLFIQLKNPPRKIKIEGLPQNVVPLICTTNTIVSTLPDDSKIQISRKQVEILPNFAITDYATQGKTRPWNTVHLNNCRSYQAYYTALSRSATAN
jgi:hypothetical protein